MAKMGSFIAYTVVRETRLDKTSFQNSDPERTSPSRRTCFSPCALRSRLSGTLILSRPSLIPENQEEKQGGKRPFKIELIPTVIYKLVGIYSGYL